MPDFASSLFGSIDLMVMVKLSLAALAGGMIGFERERHGRPAGLRTHLLVCVASCLMMVISETFVLKYTGFGSESALRLDPARTAAQIISGIGFLGAGVILKEGANIRGLTTAASLWMVAALGMAFGIGLFVVGGLTTLLALISLVWLKRFEPILKKDRYLTLKVTALHREELDKEINLIFEKLRLRLISTSQSLDLEHNEIKLEFILADHRRDIGHDLLQQISRLQGIHTLSCR